MKRALLSSLIALATLSGAAAAQEPGRDRPGREPAVERREARGRLWQRIRHHLRDRREDRLDRRQDLRDRIEDRLDRRRHGGRRDRLEDRRDRREERLDRREDRRERLREALRRRAHGRRSI